MTDSNIRRLTDRERSDLLIRQGLFEDAVVTMIDRLQTEIRKLKDRRDSLETRLDMLEDEVWYG